MYILITDLILGFIVITVFTHFVLEDKMKTGLAILIPSIVLFALHLVVLVL